MSSVYHGSHKYFDTAKPKQSRRFGRNVNGTYATIFNEVAFHATPHKWIALAYTYTPKSFIENSRAFTYTIGIDLYNHKKEIVIYGKNSLEESLREIYGDGGYVFTFDAKNFSHKEGLGNLEVATNNELTPISIEKIDDPVLQLKSLGVTFTFKDATTLK